MSSNVRKFLSSGLGLLAVAGTAGAAVGDDDSQQLQQVELLDPVIVTANTTNQTIGESLSSVTVIDQAEIERQQSLSFTDLLRGEPGVDIYGNGDFGKNTTLSIRGTSGQSTVLLIDGVRLRSATAGTPSWSFIPPELFSRIEIVRGPRSSLYGADAVGGVVQGFTRGRGPDPEGWVSLGGGEHGTGRATAGIAGSVGSEDSTNYSLAGSYFRTDGVPVLENGDPKAYDNAAGIGSLSHQFGNGVRIGGLILRAEGNTEYDGGDTDFAIQTAAVNFSAPITDAWSVGLQLAESLDDSTNDQDEADQSRFKTQTQTARLDNFIDWADHQFIIGGEFQADEVSSTVDYDEDSRDNTAVYALALLSFGPADLQLSVRNDDNEAYGSHTTGGVAVGYALDHEHRVRASYGTAFRAPTFNDLYFPDFGNSDLEAEEAENVEIGASGRYAVWFWDVALYQNEIDDLIAFTSRGGRFAPFNVNRARIRGMELSSGVDLSGWIVKGAVTISDPRDLDSDERLRRQSGKQLRLDLDRLFDNYELGTTMKAQGYRYDDADNEKRLAGFVTFDLRAAWQFAQDWTTRLKVDNVLDEEYATAEQFDGTKFVSAGRTALLSVEYQFR